MSDEPAVPTDGTESGAPAEPEPFTPPAGNRAIQVVAGVVFAALVVVVAVVLISGRSTSQTMARPDGNAGRTETTELLDRIAQHGPTLGNPTAPVTILEFVDLQCPFCRTHQLEEQPRVIRALVATGKARLTVEPLAFLGPDSELGRAVFLRLAEKDHAWDFLNRAFWNQGTENSGYMTPTWLRRVTAGIPGVTHGDLERLTTSTSRTDGVVRLGVAEAERLKHALMTPKDGTPYFVVGPTSADPTTYRKVDLGSKGSAASSIIAAVDALG